MMTHDLSQGKKSDISEKSDFLKIKINFKKYHVDFKSQPVKQVKPLSLSYNNLDSWRIKLLNTLKK